mmetsp:Transcript_32690/g.77013  ORF Transcript_32690/g.77013 Transcript_32690/m.77013 type:complete len:364 (-) Transcript_32690:207-1298(-)
MFELVLHAAPEPLREGVRAHRVPRRPELAVDELRLLVKEKILRLVGDGGDDGSHETGEEEGAEECCGGDQGEHHRVVHPQTHQLPVVFALDSSGEGVEAPEEEEERHGQGQKQALELAPGGVVLGVRRPQEERRVRRDVLILANLVGACVVEVVLFAPPGGAHARAKRPEGPHDVGELAPAVDVVMCEPASDGVGDSEDKDCPELRAQDRELREADACCRPCSPRQQVERLALPVSLEPALRNQLLPPLAEVARDLRHLRHSLRRRLRLREALDHVDSLVRVEPVHHLRRILILVEIDPVAAGRVRLPPARKVIPLVIYPNQELVVQGLRPLPNLRIWLSNGHPGRCDGRRTHCALTRGGERE